jgi:hypothetical protein
MDHNHRRIIWASTGTYNTYGEKLLDNFLNFIFLCKGMEIGMKIWRKDSRDEMNGMIMKTMGKGEVLGEYKKKIDVWRGWIGGQDAQMVSQWIEWNGVVQ